MYFSAHWYVFCSSLFQTDVSYSHCAIAPLISCWHPNERKDEPKCKCTVQKSSNIHVRYTFSVSYCQHKFPTGQKVKGEFLTFLFIFGYGIDGEEPRIHQQPCSMPFTSTQGHVSFSHICPHAYRRCILKPDKDTCTCYGNAFSCKRFNYMFQQYSAS